MRQCSLFLSIFVAVFSVSTAASADQKLQEDFREYLIEETLKDVLELNRPEFASSLAELECQYQSEQADLTMDFLRQGMTLDEIMASNTAAGMPTIVEEFIGRKTSTTEINSTSKAELVLEVAKSCQRAAVAIIADNP